MLSIFCDLSEIYVSTIYWFFLHLIFYLLESSVEVQCEKMLDSIHLWAHTTSMVLLNFLYALCDWDRCLLILPSVLFIKTFTVFYG